MNIKLPFRDRFAVNEIHCCLYKTVIETNTYVLAMITYHNQYYIVYEYD